MSDKIHNCPHCGSRLKKWEASPESSWGAGFQLVCFNNDCPYYVRGWKHMKDNFQQKASYRYRYNPQNDEEGPLPVWSPDALRDGIVEEEEEE
jgi:hypothetical protein